MKNMHPFIFYRVNVLLINNWTLYTCSHGFVSSLIVYMPLGMTKWTYWLNTKFWRSNLYTKVTHTKHQWLQSWCFPWCFKSPQFHMSAFCSLYNILFLSILFFFLSSIWNWSNVAGGVFSGATLTTVMVNVSTSLSEW